MTREYARIAFAASALVVVLVAAACSVDDRQLTEGDNAGASGTLAGAGSTGLDAGADADAAIPPLPICDYSTAVDAGCDTLVANPGFATDTAGWDAEMPSVSMTWNPSNATASEDSGSLAVVNALSGTADGFADRGAAQCLPTTPGQAYGFAADVFIPEGQGAGLDGGAFDASAELTIIFYTKAGCTGYSTSGGISDVSMDAGAWAHREGHAVAPQDAESMSVRLTTLKNFQQFKFEAHFDNVLVKAE
jgi:hypothetical protein